MVAGKLQSMGQIQPATWLEKKDKKKNLPAKNFYILNVYILNSYISTYIIV